MMARRYTQEDRTAEFEMQIKKLSSADLLYLERFMDALVRLNNEPETAQLPAQELARMVSRQITS